MKKMLSWVGVSVLVLGLALVVVTPASTRAPANTPAPTAAAAAVPVPPPHPEIRRALDALQVARTHLKEAAHDFGGHREEALQKVDAAIEQLKICMQYDR